MRAWQAVRDEMDSAISKHGSNTPLESSMDRRDKLVILVEELGEIGRCLTYDRDHAGELAHELVQLAAMAMMWAECEL